MKSNLAFSLRGGDWWKPFLPYWLLFVAEEIVLILTRGAARSSPGTALLIQLLVTIVLVLVVAVFAIIFLKIMVPKLSYADEGFSFHGKVGEFVWLNFVGILLTVITLGVFYAWYARRMAVYMASRTSYKGAELQFLGRGGRLFVLMLLGIGIPVVVMIVVLSVVIIGGSRSMQGGAGILQRATMLVTFFLVFYVLVVFSYHLYKWYVDFSWKNVRVHWKPTFWRSCGFILGQVLLSIITLTVYWPAAYLKIYRYFAEKTVMSRDDVEFGRLGFEGDLGKGFGLIWGQSLLSLITAGIYIPWATANVGRWLIGSTFVERSDR